ncbi:MAG TPA: DUF1993 domain-containing protein [Lichenihabitans sp.]|jgi:hypothetical protein|nr:DUF1993 domain-containing protein [Lichenihabitans sp.]
MSHVAMARTVEIFTTRLGTLSRLLDLAETQWREAARDPETLLAARLAEDMLPLPYQIVFACNQPNDFVAWCGNAPAPKADPSTLNVVKMKQHVDATIEHLTEAKTRADDSLFERDKRIELPGGSYLVLRGDLYVEDWLLPNFYFHLVTAYDVLRHAGVQIGKADYMAHLAGQVRAATPG